MPRQLAGILVPATALGLTLAVAGCSLPGGGAGGSAPQTSAPASAPASAPTSQVPDQPTPADPNAPVGSTSLGDPVATRTSSLTDAKVTVRLYPVQRDGAVSHLNFTLSSPAEAQEGQLSTALSDLDGKAGDATYDTVDGVQLVDGKNSKLYLAASDGKGSCLCSRGLSNVFLRDDEPVLFTVTYAAPPADVTAVDVVMPRFGTVKGVPVQ